jgi:hypothetical protein
MSTISSRARIAAASAAILGAALSMFLLRQGPSPAAAPNEPTAELSQFAAASPPAPGAARGAVNPQPARALPTAARVAPHAPALPSQRALSFDAPDCSDLSLLSVASANSDSALATVQTGSSEPEEVGVGDLLEAGEVTFIGTHPESGLPIVLLEDEAKVACRAVGPRPVAALARMGPTRPRDFAAHSTPTGDPNRVESIALKLQSGTTAARADFGSAAAATRQR